MVEKSERPFIKIKAVFPFDLFPDEITVDSNKVNVIKNDLFSRRVHSVFIKDISDIFVQEGLLFARISIVDIGFTETMINVNFLDKSDAQEARRIIQGLVVCAKQDVDISKVAGEKDFRNKLEALGEAKGVE